MLQILIITMREGIEAFLIVAITAGILRQTGRAALLPALYWGTGVAIGVSFIASWFFAQAENKPLWEGFLAAAAAIMVVTMTVYMWRMARTMRYAEFMARVGTIKAKPASFRELFFAPVSGMSGS